MKIKTHDGNTFEAETHYIDVTAFGDTGLQYIKGPDYYLVNGCSVSYEDFDAMLGAYVDIHR